MTWTVLDPTPVGPLHLSAGDGGLTGLRFGLDAISGERDDDHPVLVAAARQLGEYFAGERRDFDLPLAPAGTPFQLGVWEQLRLIPYGTTVSYGELAHRLGSPSASRAVGLANGRNPIAIVVPCHRVIGADGSLTGFGGGMAAKRTLLDLESASALF
jgi:methylated-DNA-[protein]-cysteine S-methyltransferase